MAERRAWSTGDQVVIARVTVCAHCKTGDGTYRCGRCNLVCYCSTECQKAAWKTHKMMCITALGRVNPGGSAATDWQELRMVFDTPLVKVSEAPFHSPPVETKEAVLDAFVCFVAWLQVLPAVYSDESDAAKLLQQLTVAADLETFARLGGIGEIRSALDLSEQAGGTIEDYIEALETTSNISQTFECPICMDLIPQECGPELCSQLPCGHKLHTTCLEQFTESSSQPRCPICNFELASKTSGTKFAIEIPDAPSKSSFKFRQTDAHGFISKWNVRIPRGKGPGDVCEFRIPGNFYPVPEPRSLNSAIAKHVRENYTFISGPMILHTVRVSSGCMFCCMPESAWGGFDWGNGLQIRVGDEDTTLEDCLLIPKPDDCQACRGALQGRWLYNFTRKCWFMKDTDDWELPVAPVTKTFWLSLPPILVIGVQRNVFPTKDDGNYDMDAAHIGFGALDFPTFGLDVTRALAFAPPAGVSAKYDLVHFAKLMPVHHDIDALHDGRESMPFSSREGRYVGFAKKNGKWHAFDVCRADCGLEDAAASFETASRISSCDVTNLTYIRRGA